MWLNAIPVVGHVKGAFHYLAWNKEKGDKAMYEATRSTAVIVGGAVGLGGGPVGAIGGAIAAGTVYDVAMAVKNEPRGVLKSLHEIDENFSEGKHLAMVGTILKTGFEVGMDGVAGLGASGITALVKNVGKSIVMTTVKETGKSAGISVAETVVKTAIKTNASVIGAALCARSISNNKRVGSSNTHNSSPSSNSSQSNVTNNTSKGNSTREKGSTHSSGAGAKSTSSGAGGNGKPPNGSEGERKGHYDEENGPTLLDILLSSLKNIRNHTNGEGIFGNLQQSEINSLNVLVGELTRNNTLDLVVMIVSRILKIFYPNNATYTNFLEWARFVGVCVSDEIDEMVARMPPIQSCRVRHQSAIQLISNVPDFHETIINIFNNLRPSVEIENNRIMPRFISLLNALYHYLKHKENRHNGVFSVEEYFDLINSLLREIDNTTVINHHLSSNDITLVYERFYTIYTRRVRIILRSYLVDGEIVTILSSCYIISKSYPNDKDGDVYVDVKNGRQTIKKYTPNDF